jgi:autotransporter-associated beta strand protein
MKLRVSPAQSTNRRRPILAGVFALATMSSVTFGQSFPNWNGTTSSWNNTGNWTGGNATSYGQMEFKGNGVATSNNDIGNVSQWRLYFDGSKAYTLTSNGGVLNLFDFGGAHSWVLSDATANQTLTTLNVNFAATGGANFGQVSTRNSGDLTLNNIGITGSQIEQVRFAAEGTGSIFVNGSISGTGKKVVIGLSQTATDIGATDVTFAGSNTYTGDTFIVGGTLHMASGASISNSSTVQIGQTSGSTSATLSLDAAAGGQSLGSNVVFRAGTSGTRTIASTNTSGTNTISGTVTLNANATISTAAGGALSFTGAISGGSNLTKTDAGTVNLMAANSFTGSTIISGGTLNAAAAGALTTTSSITVNSGGTLLLSGTGNMISDTAPFTLAGGTLNTGGLSETLGALTLTANSVIDFGAGSSLLTFANSSAASWGSFRLSIWNWSGNPMTGGGVDQLRFTGNGLTTAQLSQIDFFSDSGVSKISITPSFFANEFVGGAGEVVPVPEMSSTLAAIGLLGLAGVSKRRRR